MPVDSDCNPIVVEGVWDLRHSVVSPIKSVSPEYGQIRFVRMVVLASTMWRWCALGNTPVCSSCFWCARSSTFWQFRRIRSWIIDHSVNRRWSTRWTRPRRWWIKWLLFPKFRRCLTWRVICRWSRRLLGQGLWGILKNWFLRSSLFGYDSVANLISTRRVFVTPDNSL